MNTRVAFVFFAFGISIGVGTGCAAIGRKPETRASEAPPAKVAIPRPAPQGPDFSELEKYINASGKSKEVRLPRAVLSEWIRRQKQKVAECRVVEDQLEAVKAVDIGRVSSGNAKEAGSAHR